MRQMWFSMVNKSIIIKNLITNGNKGLVTNYREGGATKREGGSMWSFTPTKRGAEKVLAMLKGDTKRLGVIFVH